jgi:DNA helicase-2/ATP-dependent DNA helicase PcrA
MYKRNDSDVPAIVSELQKLYKYFIEIGIIKSVEKFEHICKFLTLEVIDTNSEKSLYEQLNNHIMDVNTYKEADLCDDSINSSIVKEKVFVSTVHKAKGLEFENVIVFGCVDGVYPFFASDDEIARKEDARKLYVAMSRAKKRLCFHSFNQRRGISRWGNPYCFDAYISPFLSDILKTYSFVTT